MVERYVISDLHLGHQNLLSFTDEKTGKKVRDFSSVQEMDETIIERWNKTVKPNDIVYNLGDVVINKRFLNLLERLSGKVRLVLGNHDIFDHKLYAPYFTKQVAMRVFHEKNRPRFIMTHVPLHPDCLVRFGFNLHGHTHQSSMKHPMYYNMCCDFPGDQYYPANNYTPLNLEQVIDDMKRVNGV